MVKLARASVFAVFFTFLVLAEAREGPTGPARGGLIPALARSLGKGPQLISGPRPQRTRDASGYLNQTSIFKGEVAHDDNPGALGRRHLLETYTTSVTLSGGQVYTYEFTGETCLSFKIEVTSGDSLTLVNLMTSSNYQTLYDNSFTGYYLYVDGSECTTNGETTYCEKSVTGLSASETYKFVAYNNNDGWGSSSFDLELTDGCTSSPSSPSSTPSSSSTEYSCNSECPLFDLFCFVPNLSIELGTCAATCGCNDNVYYGSCGAFRVRSDKWCDMLGYEYCCATSDDGCCDPDGGSIAGLTIGLIAGVALSITACAWCCKCCCFRPKPQAPVVVQMTTPVPTAGGNVINVPSQGEKFCSGCGTDLSGAAFCPSCGKKQ